MKNVQRACLAVSLALGATAWASVPGSGPVCEASPASQGLQKVGEEVVRRLESPHPYAAVERQAPPGPLHTGTITPPGAAYIAPHFATLELAEGDYVLVRAPDGSRSWRYDHTHPGARDGFWGIPIPGDTALIKLHSPGLGRLSHLRYIIPACAGGTYQLRVGCAGNRSCGGTVVYTLE
ncbi:MAG TPA: hypothetical protein VEU33_48585 [Archangium sp.]|nr:hypothetical protein [Archangium sp.]